MRLWMCRRVCLKARADTGRKRAVIIGNLHITRMGIIPLADSQNQIVWERLPLAAKPGLTEINCCRCRGTKRGVRDFHDLMVLPGTQARRGHTNDLPPLSVSVKPEDLSNKGVVMRPPSITDCQRVRARNPVEKWRIRAQTTSRTQFIDNDLPESLGWSRGKTLEGHNGCRKER